ncbi:MAG: hypothetical protein KJ961_06480, partial [Alphaproteobacteria bacterium]|nr:hypothetical protein [Alphaproteobacteria bacterium]
MSNWGMGEAFLEPDAEFAALGIPPEKRGDVSGLVDRREKMEPAAWETYARELGLSTKQLD